jgi:hypothetical protein
MSAPPTDGHPPPPTFDILAAPSPAPEPAPTRDGYLRIVRGWQHGMAELSPAHLAALEGELTDEAAMIRGATTSAADVLDESLNALVRLDVVAVVSAHARAMHFGKMRVRYIFDKVDELYGVVQAQLAQGSAWSVAQAKLERVTDDGRAVRNSLLQGFERLVRRFPSLETDVQEARGNSKNPPTVSASPRRPRHVARIVVARPQVCPALGDRGLRRRRRARSAGGHRSHRGPARRRLSKPRRAP